LELSIECQNCNSAIASHVLGQLPVEISERIEEHLLVCEACRPSVDRFESAVKNLAVFVTADPLPKSHNAATYIPQVVVIEDNPADVTLIKTALREHLSESSVTVVTDGEEAVQLLGFMGRLRSEPDLVLLDLNLPKRDGYQVLEFLRANPQLRTTPVAIFTSSDRQVDVDKAYSMGADCYVLKGHDLESFARNVGAICSFWSSAGATVPAPVAG
jgi:chemotaxis family two-component system response regulator Rcp1